MHGFVDTWARRNILSGTFWGICESSYSQFLAIEPHLKNASSFESEEDMHEYYSSSEFEEAKSLEKQSLNLGIKSIVFAGMTVEAAIYDMGAIHLGDKFSNNYLDKMDILTKWIIIPKLISGKEVRQGFAPYARLKQLIKARNKLVHHKSCELKVSKELAEKIEKESEEFIDDVHNSYRALVMLSLEMEYLFNPIYNPLASVTKKGVPFNDPPINLIPIIEECKYTFSKSIQKYE
ncbi:hypothetical protein [Chromobacterium vaccinii]|uniref:hypothetical protein n=1 Tax=Chromobacterium vaccinii TaxID=1108595 RepID=UPI000A97B595|nr:hypothetical protein [Chromobacterium vaccinii]